MKQVKLIAMAAAALVVGLSGCIKERETVDTFDVTLRMQETVTRMVGTPILPAKVAIEDGYICFVSANDAITDVYTISTNPTLGKNIYRNALGSTPVILENIPGNSTKVYMIGNVLRANLPAPVVGGTMASYMTNSVNVRYQPWTTVTGNAPLVAGATAGKKTAAITLSTNTAVIQIADITFSGDISGRVTGLFFNGYYMYMQLNGTGSSFKSSNIAADYNEDGFKPDNDNDVFPRSLMSYTWHQFFAGAGDFDTKVATTVKPAYSGQVWYFYLYKSPTPQIVLKFTDVVANGKPLAGTQFVTVNGFRNSATLENITELKGGMIYTIKAGTLVIKYENMSPVPGVTPINVDVTVVPVEWQNTVINPDM